MNNLKVLLSKLAVEQLANLPPPTGRAVITALTQLITFPESGSPLILMGYENYRQILVKNYRAIYRYLPLDNQVRVYCILHTRRQLPALEFLVYQQF